MSHRHRTYLIGSLRNRELPMVAEQLRAAGVEVFDDWYAAGPDADDKWREYEQRRGHTYAQALQGEAATHVFTFDRYHLQRCDSAVLVLPAGKSAHLELGWMLGQGKPGWVLVDSPDRWDVMYKFATAVFHNVDEMVKAVGERARNPFAGMQNVLATAPDFSLTSNARQLCFTCGRALNLESDPQAHMHCRGKA